MAVKNPVFRPIFSFVSDLSPGCEQSLQAAERLRHAVATTGSTLESGESAHITVSIGEATVHDEDTKLDTLSNAPIRRCMKPSAPGATKSVWRKADAPGDSSGRFLNCPAL